MGALSGDDLRGRIPTVGKVRHLFCPTSCANNKPSTIQFEKFIGELQLQFITGLMNYEICITLKEVNSYFTIKFHFSPLKWQLFFHAWSDGFLSISVKVSLINEILV